MKIILPSLLVKWDRISLTRDLTKLIRLPFNCPANLEYLIYRLYTLKIIFFTFNENILQYLQDGMYSQQQNKENKSQAWAS